MVIMMATIRKKDNGRYEAMVRRNGVTRYKTFILKADAKVWARDEELRIEQGIIGKKATINLSQALGKWRDEHLIKLKSYKVYKYIIANINNHNISKVNIEKIDSCMLANYRDERLKTLSNQSVKHELGVINRALKHCIEAGYITNAPYVKQPTIANNRSVRLTPDQYAELLNKADPYLKNIIILLVETGMRRGELVKICKYNIDLANKTINLINTKNGDDRLIPLSNKAIGALLYLMNQSINEERLIIWPERRITENFIKLCKGIGIDDIRLHDLRHEAVSRLFEKGLNMAEVSTISGHKDLSSLKRYTHINPTSLLSKLNN